MTMSFSNEENEIIERIALATIDGEGFLVNKLWKSFFPNAKPLENEKDFLEVIRAIHDKEKEIVNKRAKRKRIKKKLEMWENCGELYFTTLTFNDEALKTTEEERRKELIRDLNQTSDNYIANKDYGSLRGREHYHALVLNLKQDKLRELRKQTGYIDVVKVSRTLGLAIDYCMKLTNHALKDSTDGKVIYCRKSKKTLQESVNLLEDELEA